MYKYKYMMLVLILNLANWTTYAMRFCFGQRRHRLQPPPTPTRHSHRRADRRPLWRQLPSRRLLLPTNHRPEYAPTINLWSHPLCFLPPLLPPPSVMRHPQQRRLRLQLLQPTPHPPLPPNEVPHRPLPLAFTPLSAASSALQSYAANTAQARPLPSSHPSCRLPRHRTGHHALCIDCSCSHSRFSLTADH